ncbi:hypothetical protein C8F01DRAFT_623082 [Mycena amicta]|nr:hypothetical protein C8F01DRAFT_623082 [Mycena amicta]
MKGHTPESCILLQQQGQGQESLATPPVSPPNANANPFNFASTAGAGPSRIELEAIGLQAHWRDPSWTPVAKPIIGIVRQSSNDSSLVPTVLVGSDGHTIQGPGSNAGRVNPLEREPSESDVDEDDVASLRLRMQHLRTKTPMAQMLDHAHALQLCDPVLSIMRVRAADLPRMQATAGQAGLCTSIVRSPWGAPKFKEEELEVTVNWEQQTDVWLVVGPDPGLVQRTANMQQQLELMPGSFKDDTVVVQATYQQIFIASTISALVVLGGLSWFF